MSARATSITTVVVDDNEAHLDLLTGLLEKATIDDRRIVVQTHKDADEALASLPVEGEVVVLCDYLLTGASGLDWLPDFVRADVGPVILVTSSGDEAIATNAFRHGAADYVDKMAVLQDPAQLLNAIRESLRRFKLEHTNRDLTRRLKRANVELLQTNTTLAAMTDTAHRFVDDVAHEFRTPLAVIKEFASIMLDGLGGDVTQKQEAYLQFILGASRDLAHLVDDFLDSGKLRARTLRVERREQSVERLVDDVWPMVEARAEPKQVVLEREIEPGLPAVFADSDKVKRTIINLVINAVKFSKSGDVVTVAATRDGTGAVRVNIRDAGPGLTDDEVQELFERFRQGGEANRISTKGFGLGLNIVKELVAINLGTVAVSSDKGVGSTFSFTLPVHDVTHIVGAFVERTRDRSPDAVISMLEVGRPGSSQPPEAVLSFVASVCHATDIQLVRPGRRSVLVVGESAEPERWLRRLIGEDEKLRSGEGALPQPLHAQHLGTWSMMDAKDAICRIASPEKKEVPCLDRS